MSAPDLFPELDDQLATLAEEGLDDAALAESTGMFVIDSLDKANWAVRRIAVATGRLAESEGFARRERERLELWLEGERQRAERSTAFLAGLLRRYHESRLAEDPKAKTIRLPAGELVCRKASDAWDIDDAEFIAWAEANRREDLLRRKDPEVDRNAVKKALMPAIEPAPTDPVVVFDENGEVVPGVRVVGGEPTFKVKPREVDR